MKGGVVFLEILLRSNLAGFQNHSFINIQFEYEMNYTPVN